VPEIGITLAFWSATGSGSGGWDAGGAGCCWSSGGGETLDHAGLEAARERPLREAAAVAEGGEGLRVDLDDDDVVGRTARAADVEARVHRLRLERAQDVARVPGHGERDRGGADHGEHRRPRAAPGPHARPCSSNVDPVTARER
jgi:hypothetical protein